MLTVSSHDFLDVMDMLDRRMNDRGKMWRHVYKVPILRISANIRHFKFLIIVCTVDQRMLFDGGKIICTSSNPFENFNISMTMDLIKEQTVSSSSHTPSNYSPCQSQRSYCSSPRR